MAVVWIDGPPDVEVIGDCVEYTARSGETVFRRRLTRHDFRAFVERGMRALDDAEAKGSCVIAFPGAA